MTRAFTGRPGRAVRTRYVDAWTAEGAPDPALYPLQRGLTRPMREDAARAGDAERMQMWCGQAARLARGEPAGAYAERMWDEARNLLGEPAGLH